MVINFYFTLQQIKYFKYSYNQLYILHDKKYLFGLNKKSIILQDFI